MFPTGADDRFGAARPAWGSSVAPVVSTSDAGIASPPAPLVKVGRVVVGLRIPQRIVHVVGNDVVTRDLIVLGGAGAGGMIQAHGVRSVVLDVIVGDVSVLHPVQQLNSVHVIVVDVIVLDDRLP